jgi:hypothetical protein
MWIQAAIRLGSKVEIRQGQLVQAVRALEDQRTIEISVLEDRNIIDVPSK